MLGPLCRLVDGRYRMQDARRRGRDAHKGRLGYPFNRSQRCTLGRWIALRAGAHYPRSVGEFQARPWFQSDEDCLDYLEWLRWPAGFACLVCGHHAAWRLGDGRLMCSGCGSRTSVTAGTIFDRTRTPLTVWFNACWLFASGKDGISALSLKRTLEIGSYQTAWTMLHRLRAVLVRPGRERLAGMVQVDETYIGGGAGPARWPGSGQEGPDRRSSRGPGAERDGPVPYGASRRRLRGLAASVRDRSR